MVIGRQTRQTRKVGGSISGAVRVVRHAYRNCRVNKFVKRWADRAERAAIESRSSETLLAHSLRARLSVPYRVRRRLTVVVPCWVLDDAGLSDREETWPLAAPGAVILCGAKHAARWARLLAQFTEDESAGGTARNRATGVPPPKGGEERSA